MNEIKVQLPKNLAIIIAVVIVAITFGGYALFFQAQKRVASKEREFEMLKEKQIHEEENYNDLQKKFDGTSEELKQVNKDYEGILQKHQECKEKSEELSSKLDNAQQTNEMIRKQLGDCQIKAGIKPETSTTTATPDHPVQMLNKDNAPATAPATQEAPKPAAPSAPSDTPNPQSANPSQTLSTANSNVPTHVSSNNYQCPTPDMVTKNATNGNWLQGKVTWWIDFSSRPLAENEPIKDLFQVLYDGQTVACYYGLGGQNHDNVWLVVKGNSKDKPIKTVDSDGWSPCTGQDCQLFCEKQSLNRCHFKLQE